MTVERANVDVADEDGRAALFEGEPRTVHLSLSAEDRVPAHDHRDRDPLSRAGRRDRARPGRGDPRPRCGDLLRFDGDSQISPKAVTDARALVVLANP